MTTDDYIRTKIMPLVERHGHAVQAVFGDPTQPAFTYTVGLQKSIGFELLLFAAPFRVAMTVLNAIAKTAKDRKAAGITPLLPLDEPIPSAQLHDGSDSINVWASTAVVFKECDPALVDGFVNVAEVVAGGRVKVLQVLIPDKAGRFPADADFDPGLRRAQPLLFPHH